MLADKAYWSRARGTLLASALATVALALITAAILAAPASKDTAAARPSRARSGNHRSFGRNPYIARMRAPSGSAGYGMRFASGG